MNMKATSLVTIVCAAVLATGAWAQSERSGDGSHEPMDFSIGTPLPPLLISETTAPPPRPSFEAIKPAASRRAPMATRERFMMPWMIGVFQ